jgi:NCAIR mutase (PurE)-related protein
VILCHGKTNEQIVKIVEHLRSKTGTILATRANPDVFADVQKVAKNAIYHPIARMIVIGEGFPAVNNNEIMVITAGTGDIAIAEEAALTAETMGNRVGRLYDVGVAGLHRLMDHTQKMAEASVIIAVAGMEGALPSVVSGLVDGPVIAVPTSVGYGASFEGLAALLGMLNSCSPGIAVVNIDNGFGAGYLAGVINRQSEIKP